MVLKRQSGFTLMEMILVMAVITIIMAVGVPLYASLSNGSQLDAATGILVQDLYQAQTNSRSQAQDSQWGVAVNGQVITLFQGASYASRTVGQDTTYNVPAAVTISNGEIVYSKLYGLPQAGLTINLSGGGKSSSVVVNNKGMVEY